ncbi:MAG TPA: hypothetical protein VGH33_09490, partial [Isosphaeraceae bacterium]
VTSREYLTNVESWTTTEEQTLNKLSKEAAIELLRHLKIRGTDAETEAVWKDAGGHALTLQLLGRFLADAHDGDIRHYKEVKFEDADLERQGRSAFKVMKAYERWLESAGPERQRELAVLRLAGLFDRPISRDCLDVLRVKPAIRRLTDSLVKLKDTEWNIALKRLGEIDLLTVTPDTIDAHPLIREYFAKQLRENQPTAFRSAHLRLFNHLRKTTEYRPDTLDGLQPLYQAVVHGCFAGRHQEACDEVYVDRILRGARHDGHYSWRNLGAIGADLAAVAAFFDEPWSRISTKISDAYQMLLMMQAALYLRALGRLTEALQTRRAGVETAVREKDWQNAAIGTGILSELEVTLGRLPDAVADAHRSIAYADQSGDAFQRTIRRTTVADALHQSGRRAEAGMLFAEAERMQKKSQPQTGLLYGLAGSLYCDWLLAPVERTAWWALLQGPGFPMGGDDHGEDGPATICEEVERRAETTLAWVTPQRVLISIALDHLTLARVGLIRAILAHPLPQPTLDLPRVVDAVNGLRNAGSMDHLPKGLLIGALYHFVRGDAAAARTALDQAQEIAERGPMPLHLADIHLHRARLFRDRAELARARDLITKHGYGRRNEELADAEAAAGDRPA